MKTLLLLAALASSVAYATADPMVVCYFSSWAVYRPGLGKFDVEDLDPFLCTHAIFGFAGLSNHTWEIEVLDPWNENCPDDDPAGNYCAYDRFVDLKKINPNLKPILAVGGWNEGSEDYSVMVEDPVKRSTFIESCIELVQLEGFDGLDIDWEYPTQRGGRPQDKENFVLLLDEFRVRFDELGLIMTAALASGKPTIDPAYDVPGINRNMDVLSIMTYDYHGAWENFTHHNAPLCGHPDDYGDFIYFNAIYSINYWIELGASPEKMVMGIPVYGRCFTLEDSSQHDIWAPASGAGEPGPYTRLPGTLGWNEICEKLQQDPACESVRDPVMYEPYMFCDYGAKESLWCGYDDEDSVAEKARFARRSGVGGIMVWTVDTDDFVPTCSGTEFGLIKSMKNAFNEEPDPDYVECSKIIPTTPPPTTQPPTTQPPTTQPPTTQPPTTQPPTTQPPTTQPPTTQPPTTQPPTTQPPTTQPPTTQPPTTQPPTTQPPTTQPPTTQPPTTQPPTTQPPTTQPPTTQPPTTPRTTTPFPSDTTTRNPSSRPDCSADPTVDKYPHSDCNKYWWCIDGQPELWLCPPGTYYNPQTTICDYPENVDTSNCNEWLCEEDGKQYPGANCDEFYVCEHGQPLKNCCPDGNYYNPAIENCDYPSSIDVTTCNIPSAPCVADEAP